MPRRSIQRQHVVETIRHTLRTTGPAPRIELERITGVSQATLSRLLRTMNDIVPIPTARTRIEYGLVRSSISPIPVYEVDTSGTVREMVEMLPLEPRHFGAPGQVFEGLPFFLNDMRPSGFLGRLVPRQNADLGLPDDIRTWSDDVTLRYLTTRAHDPIGNLLVGEKVAQAVQHASFSPLPIVEENAYESAAENVLTLGVPGSSAAGEQPKFLIRDIEGIHRLVKFSPPVSDTLGRRVADVLIAEHIALETLSKAGLDAAKSRVVIGPKRVFLDVERFDRVQGSRGRRGLISLGSLTGQFLGWSNGWVEDCEKLARQKIIPKDCLPAIRKLALFGQLIANTDMHEGNLSFFSQGRGDVNCVSPAYDMCPMLYAPRHLQIVDVAFEPPPRRQRDDDIWDDVLRMAQMFWDQVSLDSRISLGFQSIAREARRRVSSLG